MNGLLLLTISLLVVVQVRTVLRAPTATTRSQQDGLAWDLGKECRFLGGGGGLSSTAVTEIDDRQPETRDRGGPICLLLLLIGLSDWPQRGKPYRVSGT